MYNFDFFFNLEKYRFFMKLIFDSEIYMRFGFDIGNSDVH